MNLWALCVSAFVLLLLPSDGPCQDTDTSIRQQSQKYSNIVSEGRRGDGDRRRSTRWWNKRASEPKTDLSDDAPFSLNDLIQSAAAFKQSSDDHETLEDSREKRWTFSISNGGGSGRGGRRGGKRGRGKRADDLGSILPEDTPMDLSDLDVPADQVKRSLNDEDLDNNESRQKRWTFSISNGGGSGRGGRRGGRRGRGKRADDLESNLQEDTPMALSDLVLPADRVKRSLHDEDLDNDESRQKRWTFSISNGGGSGRGGRRGGRRGRGKRADDLESNLPEDTPMALSDLVLPVDRVKRSLIDEDLDNEESRQKRWTFSISNGGGSGSGGRRGGRRGRGKRADDLESNLPEDTPMALSDLVLPADRVKRSLNDEDLDNDESRQKRWTFSISNGGGSGRGGRRGGRRGRG